MALFSTKELCLISIYFPVVEYVGVGSRTFPLVALMSSFCSASVVVPLVASAVHSWRALLALASIPSLVVPLFYKKVRFFKYIFASVLILWQTHIRFLPESPSWLLCKGRTELAAKELRRVGKVNGRCDEVIEIKKSIYNIHNMCQTFVCEIGHFRGSGPGSFRGDGGEEEV